VPPSVSALENIELAGVGQRQDEHFFDCLDRKVGCGSEAAELAAAADPKLSE